MSDLKIDMQSFVSTNDIRNIHVLAGKIIKNKDKKITLSMGDEGFNIINNGLEVAIKQICDYNLIPYENIVFESGDILETSQFFKHKYIGYNGDAVRLNLEKLELDVKTPTSLRYGLFYARPDNCRLYSFYKHLSFVHREKGSATMHFDPNTMSTKHALSQISNFVINYPDQWALVKKELPYSDFGTYIKPPITDHNNHNNFWNHVYSSTSIEIVSETITDFNSFFLTEKTFRPILYSRLFLIIGSSDFEKKLKNLGFDIFDDVIDKTYDDRPDFFKIDHIYKSLDQLLTGSGPNLLKKLKLRLKKNSKLMKEFILDEQEKYKRLSQ
jgi:hypothetical protein